MSGGSGGGGIKLSGAEERQLRAAIATASDHALAKVISVLDRHPDRGLVSGLLDAARPRLRRLRPARPLSVERLLFLPLDGAIVDARNWRGEPWRAPRTALAPIAGAVRNVLDGESSDGSVSWASLVEACRGRTFSDLETVGVAGLALWRAAGRRAEGIACPPDWPGTGLKTGQFSGILSLMAGVWRQADTIWQALSQASHGPSEAAIRSALIAASNEGPAVMRATLATLVLKAAKPGRVIGIAATSHGMPTDIAYNVMDEWLYACQPDVPEREPEGAAHAAEAFLEAFDDLERSNVLKTPERMARVAALRREAAELCRNAYATSAREDVLRRLSDDAADDDLVLAIEAKARGLRALELAGRRLAEPEAFDLVRNELIASVMRARRDAGGKGVNLTDVDLLRLVEILAGTEAAMSAVR